MEQKKFISIVCPVFNEAKYIDSFIHSILLQNYGFKNLEVLFMDGMSTDGTRQILIKHCLKYPFLRMLDNPKRTVPNAMNIGILQSKGEYIIRLDAHCLYPENYFSKLISYAEELDADNVGGICMTDVKIRNSKSLAICEVLSNRFGVGDSKFRIGAENVMEVDTVAFGCFKKSVFERFGYYDERLNRNQDIELNKRIQRGGGKIFLVPDIKCTYFARETFNGLIKNNFQNGFWNILTLYYTNTFKSLSYRHFVPLIFILSIIVPCILFPVYPLLALISLISFLTYLFVMFTNSILLSVNKNLSFFNLLTSFIFLHFSYGFGSLAAFLKLPFLKNNIPVRSHVFKKSL